MTTADLNETLATLGVEDLQFGITSDSLYVNDGLIFYLASLRLPAVGMSTAPLSPEALDAELPGLDCGPRGIVLARASLVAFDTTELEHPIDLMLDGESASLAEYCCAFAEGNRFAPSLVKKFGLIEEDGSCLILDELAVASAWQGRLIGSLLAATAIRHLAARSNVVLCRPSDLAKTSGEDIGMGAGFEKWSHGIWALNPWTDVASTTYSGLIKNAGAVQAK